MFKNREFVIKMNKANEGNDEDVVKNQSFEDRAAITHAVTKDLIKTSFLGVCAFVVLDTFRQVLVARNTIL